MEKTTLMDKIGNAIRIAGNAILMNLLFLVASLPIVTIGQAWSGLLTAVRYNIRGDKWIHGFVAGFKTRFWRGTISWIIMLAVDVFFLLDMFETFNTVGLDVPSVMAALVFALMAMITFSMQLLNVYVPTKTGQWLLNSVNMVFKAPLELLGSAVLFWAPVILLRGWPGYFIMAAMIFIAVYFVIVAVVGTLVLKNALIYYLLDARANNLLLQDEQAEEEQDEAEPEETEEEAEND